VRANFRFRNLASDWHEMCRREKQKNANGDGAGLDAAEHFMGDPV
jgi:hypothetical protein